MEAPSKTLCYIGAGWDFRPIDLPQFKLVSTFMFYDALPEKKHYEPNQFAYPQQENFFQVLDYKAMKSRLVKQHHDEEKKTITWKGVPWERTHPVTLTYTYSTDCHRQDIPEFDFLFVRGFHPPARFIRANTYVIRACDTSNPSYECHVYCICVCKGRSCQASSDSESESDDSDIDSVSTQYDLEVDTVASIQSESKRAKYI